MWSELFRVGGWAEPWTAVLAQRGIRSGSAPDELWREWLWHCSEDGRTWEIVRNIGDLRMHFGVTVAQWDAFTGVVGNFNDDLRILAAFPRSGLIGGIFSGLLPWWKHFESRPSHSASQEGQSHFSQDFWRTEFQDIDPWQDPTSTSAGQSRQSTTTASVKEKVLKMSSLIDHAACPIVTLGGLRWDLACHAFLIPCQTFRMRFYHMPLARVDPSVRWIRPPQVDNHFLLCKKMEFATNLKTSLKQFWTQFETLRKTAFRE